MSFENILIVCVGNICRSPMAAAMMTTQYPMKHIDSAGVSALVGYSADPLAIEVMAEYGIDINDHIAKQINKALVRKAELILTMTVSQTKWIEEQWPHCRGRVFRIGYWINKDIEDPYGKDKRLFEVARDDIKNSLEHWVYNIS